MLVAKINLAQQIGLYQQSKCPINRRTRRLLIRPPDSLEQFLRAEVLILGKHLGNDLVSLARPSQALTTDEFCQFFANRIIHAIWLAHASTPAKRNPMLRR